MGLSESKPEPKHDTLYSRFSSKELQKLEQYFDFKEKSESPPKQGINTAKNVTLRVTKCFPEAISRKMLLYLKENLFQDEDSERFLQFVLNVTKDCTKELAAIVFKIAGEGNQILTKKILSEFLVDFLDSMMLGISKPTICFPAETESSRRLAEKLLQQCPDRMREDELGDIFDRAPLLIDILQFKFRMVFFDYIGDVSEEMRSSMPYLIPELDIKEKAATQDIFILPLPSLMYVNSKVPMGMQHKWRLLYSTKLHGESFSKLTGAIVGKGPTVFALKDQDGHVFGGFASTDWEYSSKFQGTNKSFLFKSAPELGIYDCMGASYNDHYMYLNIGQETMPNGLGMGGQFDFFGLWIDQEFGGGHSKAKPLCTTYQSPQLSKKENFKIEALNVWGVGEEPKRPCDDEDGIEVSVLDKHVEAKALLEIAGKTRVSEGLRDADPESDIPETKELHHAHDPMS